MPQVLDIDLVRIPFLALLTGFAYRDNAGGSQVPQQVINRISDYLIGSNNQTGASYNQSQLASARALAARESMKELINARRSEEVAVSGSTTLLMFMLCQALAPTIQQGDEINRLIQALERHSQNAHYFN